MSPTAFRHRNDREKRGCCSTSCGWAVGIDMVRFSLSGGGDSVYIACIAGVALAGPTNMPASAGMTAAGAASG